jgi:long-chain fatty acid transport protein
MTVLRLALLSAAAAAVGSAASATAFQLREGSATSLGAALAGRTANDRDVSLIIQNPAALAGVAGAEVSAGAAYIYATGDARSEASLPGFTSTDDPNETGIVPSFAAGYRLSPEIALGFALDAPFGLATEYSSRFVGSFDGVRSELTTITATPMIAYTPHPVFTVAAGLSIQYADSKLTSNVGPGGVAAIEGDGFDLGFTFGMQAEPIEGTRLGLAFQSGYRHKLEGEFSPNFPAVGGRDGEAAFELPPVLSFGVIQDVTDDLRLMAEVEWTGWSAFENILITDAATGGVVLDDEQGYGDSAFVSFGAEYDLSDALSVRGGVGYDSTPTRDALRTVRTPDSDRWWLSAGASYEITERVGIDFGYTLILIEDTTVILRNGPPAGTRVDYTDSMAHVLQTNLRYEF